VGLSWSFSRFGLLPAYVDQRIFGQKEVGQSLALWLPVLFFSATYFVFEGQPRYIFPMLPLFVIMAAWGLQSIKKTASY